MPINDETIKLVATEMERFTMALKNHRFKIKDDKYYAEHWHITGGPETAAIRRASMDLTRALARLRSNG